MAVGQTCSAGAQPLSHAQGKRRANGVGVREPDGRGPTDHESEADHSLPADDRIDLGRQRTADHDAQRVEREEEPEMHGRHAQLRLRVVRIEAHGQRRELVGQEQYYGRRAAEHGRAHRLVAQRVARDRELHHGVVRNRVASRAAADAGAAEIERIVSGCLWRRRKRPRRRHQQRLRFIVVHSQMKMLAWASCLCAATVYWPKPRKLFSANHEDVSRRHVPRSTSTLE